MALKVDLTHRASLQPAFDQIENELGRVGILVNNAGIVNVSGGILQEEPEDWDQVIETQLNAVFLLSKIAAHSMVQSKQGKVINIGSMYSYFGSGLAPSYSSAKGAIVHTEKLAMVRTWTTAREMDNLVRLCGFRVETVFGGFDCRPFDEDSTEMIWVLKRA